MGEIIHKDMELYSTYREYMKKKYGAGPWSPLKYPQMVRSDKFLVWRRNNYPERFGGKYDGILQVYREEVSLSSRGGLTRRSGGRSRRSGKRHIPNRRYRFPGTLA